MTQVTLYEPVQPLISGQIYVFPVFLFETENSQNIKINPTIAVGDVKVSKDGGGYSNITNLPVEVDSTGELTVSLTALETTGSTKYITVKFSDVSGSEWTDTIYQIDVFESKIIDLDNLDVEVSSRLDTAGYTPPPSPSTISTSVWSEPIRTLSSFGFTVNTGKDSVIDNINSNVLLIPTSPLLSTDSRLNYLDALISSRSTLTDADVWEYAVRTLTSGGGGITAEDVWTYATRELTDFGFTVDINSNSDISAIKSKTDNLPINPASQTNLDVAVSTRSTISASDVWGYITRTLTSSSGISAADVWSYATRELTGFDFTVETIKDLDIDSIKNKTDNLPINPASQTNLDVAVSTRLPSSSYVAPDNTTIQSINTNMVTNTDPRLDYLDALISSRSTLTAADVWTYATRVLTSFGFTVDINSNSDIVAIKSKTNNLPLNPASQTNLDVAVSSRLASSDVRLNALDTTISSRSTLVASDVWNNPTRTLTSGGGSGGATPTEIWEYPTRTITGASGLASSIWEYENRSLTNWRNIVSDIWKSIPKWFLEKVESIVESDIIVYKGVTNNITITSPENVKGSSNIVFSVKNNYQDPDEKSIMRIELINGLVVLNGQQYLPSINGGITVVDENEGIINIYIHSEASADFVPSQKRVYDILSRVGDEVKLVSRGKIDILPDVTKTV